MKFLIDYTFYLKASSTADNQKVSLTLCNLLYNNALNLTNNNCLNDFLKEKAKIFPLKEFNKNRTRRIYGKNICYWRES